MPIGVSPFGPVAWNPAYAPHVLVTGDTGSGKSSVMRAILMVWPGDVLLLDPKILEFGAWDQTGRVLVSTGDMGRAAEVLKFAAETVTSRMQLLAGIGATHWRDADALSLGFRPWLLMFDEALVGLEKPIRGEDEKSRRLRTEGMKANLQEVIVLGRACGIHALIGMQRPDASVLGGGVSRDNLKGRIALGRVSQDGRTMMFGSEYQAAAARLLAGRPGHGAAVGLNEGMGQAPVQFQGAFFDAADARLHFASGEPNPARVELSAWTPGEVE